MYLYLIILLLILMSLVLGFIGILRIISKLRSRPIRSSILRISIAVSVSTGIMLTVITIFLSEPIIYLVYPILTGILLFVGLTIRKRRTQLLLDNL